MDKFAITNAIYQLDRAFQNLFEGRASAPCFKSRKDHHVSYTTNITNDNIALLADENAIKLPKLGGLKAMVHRRPDPDGKLKRATISKEADGSYYASLVYEYPKTEVPLSPIAEEEALGLDYKSDGLYMDHAGEDCDMPKYFRCMQKKLAQEQRKLSRKAKESHNYEKQRVKVARIHKKIARQREDFLRKKAHSIAKNYRLVCVEDLDMQALSNKGFGNGKATMDNGWGKFMVLPHLLVFTL